jgi:TRAP-type C4-dicarboxylate transport system permease small subunit
MIDNLLRGVRGLLAVISVLSGVLLSLSVALNFANVIGRYFFNASIPWAEEAMLFLMVGCVFLGNGLVAWSGRYIRMDIIVNLLPAKVRAVLELLSDLVFLATTVAIVVFAWPVIRDLAAFDQRSQAADFRSSFRRPWSRSGSRSWLSWSPCDSSPPIKRRQSASSASLRTARTDYGWKRHRCWQHLRLFHSAHAAADPGAADFPRSARDLPDAVLFVADVPTEAIQTYCSAGSTISRCWPCRSSSWRARSWRRAASRAGWSSG